jgi:hypothetical protein
MIRIEEIAANRVIKARFGKGYFTTKSTKDTKDTKDTKGSDD